MLEHFVEGWGGIDESPDPDFFLTSLDVSRAGILAHIERDPERYFSWLEPRPGMAVLEVGCGPGNLTQILARLCGPEGRAVGLDASRYLIAEARQRSAGADVPLEFIAGDAHNLPFADGTFDRTLANITFQHLDDPERALAELVRVTRPGGLIVVADQDWDTLIVDAGDLALTRILIHAFADGLRHGTLGRRLFGLFHDAGLEEVRVIPETGTYSSFAHLRPFLWQPIAAIGHRRSLAPDAAIDAWLADLEERDRQGRFFASSTVFRAVGRKPGAGESGRPSK